jgi:fucose 4-O-acetylase-like acetyltransferase
MGIETSHGIQLERAATPKRGATLLRRILLAEIPYGKPQQRLLDIDAARGLAITLVVIGHIGASKMPAGNHWYLTLMALIYQFHMPLFMTLTGITFALSLPPLESWSEVFAYSTRRIKRLFVPYLILGLAVLAGKTAAVHFVHVDNPPTALVDDLAMLLLAPTDSVARFLWFVYVLSVYLIFVPALFHVCGRRPVVLLALGLALCPGEWTDFFMLNRVVYYLPFFALGMILWMHRAWWSPMPPVAFWSSAALFGAMLVLSSPLGLPRWLVGACSVLPVLGLMQRLPSRVASALGWVGKYSLSIYLFSELSVGAVKGALWRFVSWDGHNFFLFFPLLLLVGLGVPLAVKYAATRWSPRIANYI